MGSPIPRGWLARSLFAGPGYVLGFEIYDLVFPIFDDGLPSPATSDGGTVVYRGEAPRMASSSFDGNGPRARLGRNCYLPSPHDAAMLEAGTEGPACAYCKTGPSAGQQSILSFIRSTS